MHHTTQSHLFWEHHCLIDIMHHIRLILYLAGKIQSNSHQVQAMKPGFDRIISWFLQHIVKPEERPDNSIKHRESWILPDSGLSLSYEARIRPDNSLIPSKSWSPDYNQITAQQVPWSLDFDQIVVYHKHKPWSPDYDRITAQQVIVKPGLRPDSNTRPWSLDYDQIVVYL